MKRINDLQGEDQARIARAAEMAYKMQTAARARGYEAGEIMVAAAILLKVTAAMADRDPEEMYTELGKAIKMDLEGLKEAIACATGAGHARSGPIF